MHKYEKLRDLEEQIANLRNQPIFSDEEKEKLEDAEQKVHRAAVVAEETKKEGDPLRLFEDQSAAELHGNDLGLTSMEFELLFTLKERSPKALTRKQLLDEVFPPDAMMVTERTIGAHIKNLREKLGYYKDRIQTVRGIGYRYTDEPFGET